MPTVTSANITEWKMRELARRAGKKYEPETKNPFQGMSKEELKAQQDLIKAAKKELKTSEENK